MASGPYQSNLLRFFVGQYWQGLARHRRAIRETRSTIMLGSEIGFTVALAPVAAVVRASQKQLQKLRQSVTKLRLSIGRSQVSRLLDFSGFDRILTVSDRLNSQNLKPLFTALQAEGLEAGKTGSITPSISGLDASIERLLLEDALAAEVAMAQTLLSIGDCLLPQQIEQLTHSPSQWLAPVVQGWHLIKDVVSASRRKLTQSVDSSGELLDRATEPLERVPLGRITGVASDLETRSLILVIDHVRIWDGLTQTQQIELQRSISRFIEIDEAKERVIGSQPAVPLSGQRSLFGLLPARRVAVDREGAKLSTGISGALIVQPFHFLMGVIFGPDILIEMPMGPRLPARFVKSLEGSTGSLLLPDGMAGGRQFLDIEATVVAAEYIVHPLEKLLKWVDRMLLWVETQWAVLKSWLF